MEKISIKDLVDFRRKSDKVKKRYAEKIKNRKPKEIIETKSEGGGDYWITSTSCIRNVIKDNNKNLYDLKIDELHSKFEFTELKRTKSMYQRNINILNSFKDFDLDDLKPIDDLKYEKVLKLTKIVAVNNFPLFVDPSLIYSFDKNGEKELGALWLIPRLDGFSKDELGMFCEMLYRFLIKNYSEKNLISEKYCIVIDTFNARSIKYTELTNGDVPFLIDKTLKEIKEL